MMLAVMMAGYAFVLPYRQDDNTRRRVRRAAVSARTQRGDTARAAARRDSIIAQPLLADDDSIPDSLLHPRWLVQRTMPITLDDLDQNAADLKRPDNLKQDVVYNDSLDRYIIGSKISNSYINAPFMMTQDEILWDREIVDGTVATGT